MVEPSFRVALVWANHFLICISIYSYIHALFYFLVDAPQLSLSLGAKIPETMREGSDVYFECLARANPALSEVVWLFEGRPLLNDPVSGILLTNQSLVMQRVRREHRGYYQCVASNPEGVTASNKVFLNVLCECLSVVITLPGLTTDCICAFSCARVQTRTNDHLRSCSH